MKRPWNIGKPTPDNDVVCSSPYLDRVARWWPQPPSTHVGRMLTGITLAVVAVTTVGVTGARWVSALPSDAAYRLGDTVRSEQYLHRRVDLLKGLYGIEPPPPGPAQGKFWRDAAKAVAVTDVLDQQAAQRHIVVPDRVAQGSLQQMIDSQPNSGGRDGFIKLLGSAGLSEKDVLGEIKRQQTTGQLYNQVTSKVPPVTDNDVRKDFDQHNPVDPEKRHLRNIVVPSREQADGVIRSIQSGRNFAELVQQQSLDQSTRDKQGDLGLISRDQLETPYGDAAFTATTGQVFGPVHTKSGWNVGQVIDTQPAKPLQFDQIKGQLQQTLQQQRKTERWQTWLTDCLHQADIEYADKYRPENPYGPESAGPSPASMSGSGGSGPSSQEPGSP